VTDKDVPEESVRRLVSPSGHGRSQQTSLNWQSHHTKAAAVRFVSIEAKKALL
jgi:hypothetical protein